MSTLVLGSVVLCWLVLVAGLVFMPKPAAGQESKRAPAARIGLALQAVSYLPVWALPRVPRTPPAPMSGPVELTLALFTVACAAGSVFLVLASIRTLGRQWSVEARLLEAHRLVTEGPYGWVRHPIYAGMLGLLVATGLAWSEGWVIGAALPVFLAGTFIRVRAEERLLREALPAEFEAYRRRVPAIVPWLV